MKTIFLQNTIKYRILFIISLMLLSLSCEDALLEEPLSVLAPENFYKTEQEAIISVNAVYQSMKDNFVSTSNGVHIFLDNAADQIQGNQANYGLWYNGAVTSSDTRVISWWKRSYATIGACNTTIGRIENTQLNEDIKNRVIAEAKFLRALNYFYIARVWGPAPLKTTIPSSSDNQDLPRESLENIYAVIIEDLKFSEEFSWGKQETREVGGISYTNDLGRVTKGAAKALLAKVYLKLASTSNAANRRNDSPLNSGTGQVDGLEAYKVFDANAYYNLCIEKCNEVEALGYALHANYMDNFNLDKKNGVESLFEVQSFNQLDYGSRLAPFYSPPFSGLYGGTWGGTHGFSRPFLLHNGPFGIYKNALYNYRPEEIGDPANQVTKFPFDISDKRYREGFVFDYNRINQNNRPYRWDAGSARYIGSPSGSWQKFHTSKYIDLNGTIHDDNGNNWVLLRFADVLLMKAEALFETNRIDESWESIKRVHKRDGNQNIEATNVFADDYQDWMTRFDGATIEEQFREGILYERNIELFMEGHRYFDLLRLGKLEEKSAVTGRVKTRKHYYFPIPQTEINANQAIDFSMNNPGY